MNKIPGKILVVDDDDDVLLSARLFLKQHFAGVLTEKDPDQLIDLLSSNSFDVILLDMNFSAGSISGKEGLSWLKKLLETDPSIPVIMITAYGEIEVAVKAIKEGAFDFVVKPWQNEKLLATVLAAYQLRTSKVEINRLRQREKQLTAHIDKNFSEFIGVSASMQKVFSTIEKVAKADANVLILGENGTGKELVARSLHRHSNRSGPFVNVDLGAISETLFESELFGHTKGSYTDAREDRAGRFEIASGGTLFLDEIGNLSLALQSKLLTAIQNKQITRIGSNKSIATDIRLVCATNMPLHEMVLKNQFRQDLLYRINTVEITLPNLCERSEDISILSEHFLTIFKKKYNKPNLHFSEATLKKLEKYHWPGNIRELQHAVERAVIMGESDIIQPADFFFSLPGGRNNEQSPAGHNLENLERSTIQKVISKHSGNITKAAKELGLTRAALYRRIEKYGL